MAIVERHFQNYDRIMYYFDLPSVAKMEVDEETIDQQIADLQSEIRGFVKGKECFCL